MRNNYISTIKNSKRTLGILIPAAGEGSRMRSFGPKPLIPIGKESLIQRQIRLIQNKFRPKKLSVVTGYESQKVMDSLSDDILKLENERYFGTNIARSIGIGLRTMEDMDGILLVYGDLVFNSKALSFLFHDYSFIVTSNTMSKNEVGCMINNGTLENMFYDREPRWAQIAYFTGRELEALKSICFKPLNYRWFGFEIINEIIRLGGKFKTYSPQGIKINDIDSSKDVDQIGKII